jgi:hypothetical protein
MRALPVLVLVLASCGREPGPPPPPPPAPPRPPIVNRVLPAPQERIAFAREDGLWTVTSDGGDLQRIVPPTCPEPSEPTWGPDRRWIAFTAAANRDSNLFPRNVFVARPDGTEFRQVTPLPAAGLAPEDVPRAIVRGRAVVPTPEGLTPAGGLRVTCAGRGPAQVTDSDGTFQAYVPMGLGWIKISGEQQGRPVAGWRFVATVEGRATDLKDIALSSGPEDFLAAPAWCADGEHLLYLLHHPSSDPRSGAARMTLRRIKSDGSQDETIASFTSSSVLAGPVVRGDSAWCKTSAGSIVRFDLKTKSMADSRPVGISAPDALAVSPDGRMMATLTLDPSGTRSLLVLGKDPEETVLTFKAGEAAPHALDFSPDGARLVLDRHTSDGRSSLWILTLGTRKLVRLVENGASPVWHGR